MVLALKSGTTAARFQELGGGQLVRRSVVAVQSYAVRDSVVSALPAPFFRNRGAVEDWARCLHVRSPQALITQMILPGRIGLNTACLNAARRIADGQDKVIGGARGAGSRARMPSGQQSNADEAAPSSVAVPPLTGKLELLLTAPVMEADAKTLELLTLLPRRLLPAAMPDPLGQSSCPPQVNSIWPRSLLEAICRLPGGVPRTPRRFGCWRASDANHGCRRRPRRSGWEVVPIAAVYALVEWLSRYGRLQV